MYIKNGGLYVGQVMLLSDPVETLLELNLEWWWGAHPDEGQDLVTQLRVFPPTDVNFCAMQFKKEATCGSNDM